MRYKIFETYNTEEMQNWLNKYAAIGWKLVAPVTCYQQNEAGNKYIATMETKD